LHACDVEAQSVRRTPILNVTEITETALHIIDPAARARFLDSTCESDELRREVEASLLQLESRASTSETAGSTETLDAATGMPFDLADGAGFCIGPYKPIKRLGTGGMGVVYQAEQHAPIRRSVALKIIKPGMDTERVIARFHAERQALAMMDHPNIAKVMDAGATASGLPYFVMELVEGASITSYCDAQRLNARERTQLFIPVCQAVQHAHQKGIIHRDLKPSNILVATYDGRAVAKIIDFGIAKATQQSLTDRAALTHVGTAIGTLLYMSPEQAEGHGGVDTRTDIYSLGVVLYELLTGSTPLDTNSEVGYLEMIRRIRQEEPAAPSVRIAASLRAGDEIARLRNTSPAKLARSVTGELDWILMKALDKDPAQRYGAASGLARDLERYLNGEPVEAGPPSATYRIRKFTYKHRAMLLTLAAFVVLLAAGAATSVWQAIRAGRERDRAVAALHEANAGKLAAYAEQGLAEEPERSIMLAMHAVNATVRFGQAPLANAMNALHAALRLSHVRRSFGGHKDRVRQVAVSPDGARIITGSSDKTAKVWDIASGRELLTLRGHSDEVWTVAFSSDGKRVATAGPDRIVKIWDAVTGRELLTLRGHRHSITKVSFSPNDEYVATSSVDRSVKLWKSDTGQNLHTFRGYEETVACVSFSSDGARMVMATADKATILDVPTRRELLRVQHSSEGPIYSAVFSIDDKRIATGSFDGSIKLWDAKTGAELSTLQGHQAPVLDIALSRDGKRLASGSLDRTIKLWDLATGREIRTYRGYVESVAFGPNGSTLFSTNDATAKMWTTEPDQEPPNLRGHDKWAGSVAYSPDGGRIVTASTDGTRVWDAATGREMLHLKEGRNFPNSATFSTDGTRIVAAASDRAAKVWDAANGKELLHLRSHTAAVRTAAFSPDEQHVITGSNDMTAKVWNARTGRELFTLSGHTGFVRAVAVSPDGKLIASAATDGTARLWKADTGRQLFTLRHKSRSEVFTVAFSKDGARVLTASSDGTAKVWNSATGEEALVLRGHAAGVSGAVFSTDDARIATSGTDGTLRVWNARNGEELLRIRSEIGESFTSVAFDPRGKRLVAGTTRGPVRVFLLDTQELLKFARTRVTRSFTPAECGTYFGTESCPTLP
jgi:eukaryotic-like serine/threonine-protein kinase